MSTEQCEALGKYISNIYRQGNTFLSKKLSVYGIGHGQYLFLIYLYKCDGINQEELSEIINIDKGTTARAIKKLEENGLVERIKDEHDKRAYKIFVTQKAQDIKKGIYEVLEEWEEILTANLNSQEKKEALDILRKISSNQYNLKGV